MTVETPLPRNGMHLFGQGKSIWRGYELATRLRGPWSDSEQQGSRRPTRSSQGVPIGVYPACCSVKEDGDSADNGIPMGNGPATYAVSSIVRRFKTLSARPVARGGESGISRFFVPALVISVVALGGYEVRAASEDAESALDSAAVAQRVADQVVHVQTALAIRRVSRGRRSDSARSLMANRRQLQLGVEKLAAVDTDRQETRYLLRAQRAADGALARMIAVYRARHGLDSGRTRRRLQSAASRLAETSTSASTRLRTISEEKQGRARRYSTWVVGGGALLLALLLWTFWANRRSAQFEHRERRFEALLQNSSDLALIVDIGGRISYASPAIEAMLGHSAERVVGMEVDDLVHADDHPAVEKALRSATDNGSSTSEWRVRHADGTFLAIEASCSDLTADRSVGGILARMRSVGERKALEDQLRYQAFHDPLTDLPNRALFEDRVSHSVGHARRHDDSLAVLFIDLDDFKTINDSLGHAAGDELLRQVAARIYASARTSDTAARLGGDEFALLAERMSVDQDALAVADRIHRALEKPFDLLGNEVFVHASIGIAIYAGEEGAEELLRNADIAMYAAKSAGKRRSEIFRPSMHLAARMRLQLTADLRRAIQDEELVLHYQPLVTLAESKVIGVEALLRWQHPTLGLVPPLDFIPLAEETGLIVPVGQFVLNEACRQTKSWQDLHPGRDPLYVSVNVSARQFQPAGQVLEQVREATSQSGLDPGSLMLELTESLLAENQEAVVSELRELRDLGVRIAIDDFGTGYSALSYLRNFPIDTVKMDRSFVHDLAQGAGDAALVRSMLELGEALAMEIVAEGIESRQQVESLSTLRCGIGQGFHFAPPLDADTLERLLAGEDSASPAPGEASAAPATNRSS